MEKPRRITGEIKHLTKVVTMDDKDCGKHPQWKECCDECYMSMVCYDCKCHKMEKEKRQENCWNLQQGCEAICQKCKEYDPDAKQESDECCGE